MRDRSWDRCRLANTPALIALLIFAGLCKDTSAFSPRLAIQPHHHTNHKILSSMNAIEKKRNAGQANQRAQRQVKQEDRIAILTKNIGKLTEAEQKELQGLSTSNFVEQYSSLDFTPEHTAFKAEHNQIFLKLCLYCQSRHNANINVFYLDGPCAGTTKTLRGLLNQSQCYTANRHEVTCEALKKEGLIHVAHNSAKDALSKDGLFGGVLFHAFYFDGCGGYVPMLIEMIEAAFVHGPPKTSPIAIGFSLIGGGRDCVDKEQDVLREIVQLVKPMGFRVDHVGDDPSHYGINEATKKVESSTLTTWCMIVEN